MKPSRGKLPLSVLAVVICGSTIHGLSPCTRLDGTPRNSKHRTDEKKEESVVEDEDDSIPEEEKVDFDPESCSADKGKWVFDATAEPLYSDETCPYLDKQVSTSRSRVRRMGGRIQITVIGNGNPVSADCQGLLLQS